MSNYQFHSVDLKLLDLAHQQAELLLESSSASRSENDQPMMFWQSLQTYILEIMASYDSTTRLFRIKTDYRIKASKDW